MKDHRRAEVGLAAFKAHLSSYLRRVRGGAELIVLNRDTPIARVVPIDQQPASLPVRQPVRRLRDVKLLGPLPGIDSLGALLEDRQAER